MARFVRPLLLFLAFLAAFAAAGTARAEDLVPDAVGLPVASARTLFESAGYTVRVEWTGTGEAEVVSGQTPAGFAAAAGHQVTLVVGGTAPAAPAGVTPPVPRAPTETPPAPPPAPAGDVPGPGPEPSGADVLPPTGPLPTVPGGPGGETPPAAPPGPGPGAAPTGPAVGAPGRGPAGPAGPAIDLSGVEEGRMLDRSGPPLPSALGIEEAAAHDTLDGWKVQTEHTVGIPDLVGRVVNQMPYPGTPLAKGEVVTLVVAVKDAAPNEDAVPALVGHGVEDAVDRARTRGYAPRLLVVPSTRDQSRKVLAQRPLGGSLAVRGTDVWLFVGKGGLAPGAAPAGPLPETTPEPLPPPGAPGSLPATPPATTPPPVPPPHVLVAPTLVSPSEGQSFPRAYGSTFQWAAVEGASRYEWALEAEGADGAYGEVAREVVNDTRYRPARMESARYRWRVRALDSAGAQGPWSPWFRLYMYGP